MALKADRRIIDTDVSYFYNYTADAGVVLCQSTAGSGSAMDSARNVAVIAATVSGAIPVGLLLQEVVSIDLTKFHINDQKDQVASGNKVTLLTKGWAVTNKLTDPVHASSGAVLAANGTLTDGKQYYGSYDAVVTPKVGRFLSNKDEDGYAKVYIDL